MTCPNCHSPTQWQVAKEVCPQCEQDKDKLIAELQREADNQTEIANAMTDYCGDEKKAIAEMVQWKHRAEQAEAKLSTLKSIAHEVVESHQQYLKATAQEMDEAIILRSEAITKLKEAL